MGSQRLRYDRATDTFTFMGLEADRVELWREPALSSLAIASGEAITVSSD